MRVFKTGQGSPWQGGGPQRKDGVQVLKEGSTRQGGDPYGKVGIPWQGGVHMARWGSHGKVEVCTSGRRLP